VKSIHELLGVCSLEVNQVQLIKQHVWEMYINTGWCLVYICSIFLLFYSTVCNTRKHVLGQFSELFWKISILPGPLWFMSPWEGSTRTEQAAPVHHWVHAFNSRRHFECGTPRGATGPPSWNYSLHFLRLCYTDFFPFLIYHMKLLKDINNIYLKI